MEIQYRKLLELLSEHLDKPIAELEKVDRFDELDIDSIGLIDMITLVETAFAVRIENGLLDNIHSVTDLLHALDVSSKYENS